MQVNKNNVLRYRYAKPDQDQEFIARVVDVRPTRQPETARYVSGAIHATLLSPNEDKHVTLLLGTDGNYYVDGKQVNLSVDPPDGERERTADKAHTESRDALTVIGYVTASEGKEAELEAALLALVGPTLQEPGNKGYVLHASCENSATFLLVEQWESEAALADHKNRGPYQTFMQVASSRGLIAGTPHETHWNMITDPVEANK